MRHQRWELGLNGSVMLVVGADQNPVPVPAAGFRWLNEQQHQTPEEVRGKATEHSPGEEGRVLNKRFENPLVFKRLHVIASIFSRSRRRFRSWPLIPQSAAVAREPPPLRAFPPENATIEAMEKVVQIFHSAQLPTKPTSAKMPACFPQNAFRS